MIRFTFISAVLVLFGSVCLYCDAMEILSANENLARCKAISKGKYPNYFSQSWVIYTDEVIKFSSIEFRNNPITDYVMILSNTTHYNPEKGTFNVSGSSAVDNAYIVQGPVVVIFVSDKAKNCEGFSFFYRNVEGNDIKPPMQLINSATKGVIKSHPEYPLEYYKNNYLMQWKFSVQSQQSLILNFTDFNTESEIDKVTVYTNNNTNYNVATVSGKLAGKFFKIDNANGSVIVAFASDGNINDGGFVFHYKILQPFLTVTSRNGTIKRTITTEDEMWKIDVNASLLFTVTEFEQYAIAELWLFTNYSSPSTAYDTIKLTGSDNVGRQFLMQGPVFILFMLKGSESKFSVTYSVVDRRTPAGTTEVIKVQPTKYEEYVDFKERISNAAALNCSIYYLFRVLPNTLLQLTFSRESIDSVNDGEVVFDCDDSLSDVTGAILVNRASNKEFLNEWGLLSDGDLLVRFNCSSASYCRLKYHGFQYYPVTSQKGELSFSTNQSAWKIDTNQSIRIRFNVSLVRKLQIDKLKPNSTSEFMELLGLFLGNFNRALQQNWQQPIAEYLIQGPVVVSYRPSYPQFDGVAFSYEVEPMWGFLPATEFTKLKSATGKLTIKRKNHELTNCIGVCAVAVTVTAASANHVTYFTLDSGDDDFVNEGNNSIAIYQGSPPFAFSQRPIAVVNMTDNSNNNNNNNVVRVIGDATFVINNYLPNYSVNYRWKYAMALEETMSQSEDRIQSYTNNKTGEYYNGAHDVWIINRTDTIRMKVVEFETEKYSDKVFVYDGNGELRNMYHGSLQEFNIVESVLQGPVTVKFISDSFGSVNKGFVIDYRVDDEFNAALPTYLVNSKPTDFISSHPEFNEAKYSNNQSSTWVIRLAENQLIDFSLYSFDLDATNNDKLTIHKGLPSHINNNSQIIQFTGKLSELRQWAVVTEGTVTVTFETDSQDVGDGFQLLYHIGNVETVTASEANITTASPVKDYELASNQNQVLKINITGTVRITVKSFTGNKLWFYDSNQGYYAARFVITKYKGYRNFDYLLQGPVLIWQVYSGANEALNISYVTVSDDATTIPTMIQTFRSAECDYESAKYLGYDSDSVKKYESAFVFETQLNQKVFIKFYYFRTSSLDDSAKLFNGSYTSSALRDTNQSPILEFTGKDSKDDFVEIYQSTGTATVVFAHDTLRGRGASLWVYGFLVNEVIIASINGTINTQVNAKVNKFYNKVDDRWIINVTSFVRIRFNRFNVSNGDKVLLYSGTTQVENDKLISAVTKLSEAQNTEYVLPGPVLVRFRSDSGRESDGFVMNVTTDQTEKFTHPTEIITVNGSLDILSSAEFGSNYSNNFVKVWQILVKDEQSFDLFFKRFKLQSPGDTLTIHKGLVNDFGSDSQIFQFTGEDVNKEVVSLAGNVTLVFETDATEVDRGFLIRLADAPMVVLNSSKGNISGEIAEGNGFYTDGYQRWLINITDPILIQFGEFFVEAETDFVKLYEATPSITKANLKFTVNDANAAVGSQYILQGPAVVRFASFLNSFSTHFNLNYTALSRDDDRIRNIVSEDFK